MPSGPGPFGPPYHVAVPPSRQPSPSSARAAPRRDEASANANARRCVVRDARGARRAVRVAKSRLGGMSFRFARRSFRVGRERAARCEAGARLVRVVASRVARRVASSPRNAPTDRNRSYALARARARSIVAGARRCAGKCERRFAGARATERRDETRRHSATRRDATERVRGARTTTTRATRTHAVATRADARTRTAR